MAEQHHEASLPRPNAYLGSGHLYLLDRLPNVVVANAAVHFAGSRDALPNRQLKSLRVAFELMLLTKMLWDAHPSVADHQDTAVSLIALGRHECANLSCAVRGGVVG